MKISCLCLDKRKEMWTTLDKQVKDIFNIDMEKFIVGSGSDKSLTYDHIDVNSFGQMLYYGINPLAHYNAFLSHKKMIDRAIAEKVDSLLIIEDDSYIIEDRVGILYSDRVQKFLQNNDWDIVYLGWWMTKHDGNSVDREDLEVLWNQEKKFDIARVPRPPEIKFEIAGLHGLLINQHFLKIMATASVGPMDSCLNRNLDKIKAYYIWPKVIHVHSTWSYCENSFTERNKI